MNITARLTPELAAGRGVGAENRVTSCDLHILVDEAAESISAEHADGRPGTWRGVACGRALIQ